MVRVIVEHFVKSPQDVDSLVHIIYQLRQEAMKQPGYITGETLINEADPTNVLVISTWNKEEQWNAWDTCELRTGITKQALPLLKQPYSVRIYNFAMIKAGRVPSMF